DAAQHGGLGPAGGLAGERGAQHVAADDAGQAQVGEQAGGVAADGVRAAECGTACVQDEAPLGGAHRVAGEEDGEHADPGGGREPAGARAHLAPRQHQQQDGEDAEADERLEPGLHRRFIAMRAFWSASRPTAQTISAPSIANTALSDRFLSTTSYANLASPTSMSSAPSGMKPLSGLKKTIVRRISSVIS